MALLYFFSKWYELQTGKQFIRHLYFQIVIWYVWMLVTSLHSNYFWQSSGWCSQDGEPVTSFNTGVSVVSWVEYDVNGIVSEGFEVKVGGCIDTLVDSIWTLRQTCKIEDETTTVLWIKVMVWCIFCIFAFWLIYYLIEWLLFCVVYLFLVLSPYNIENVYCSDLSLFLSSWMMLVYLH